LDEIHEEKTGLSHVYNSEIATSHLPVPKKYVRKKKENNKPRKQPKKDDYYLTKHPLAFASKTKIPPKKLLGTNITIGPPLDKKQTN
jgi:hypothetical protein